MPKNKPKPPPVTYHINIHVYSANGLPPCNHEPGYFLRVHLVGAQDKATTRCIGVTSHPVWDEDLEALPGSYAGSDLLRIEVFDKASRDEKQKDVLVAWYERPVRQFRLGYTLDEDFLLIKHSDSRDKASGSVSGISVRLKLHFTWPGQPPFVDAPWTVPFYTAEVEFVSATDCPVADVVTSDPYLVVEVRPGPNSQKVHTNTCKSTLEPVWNQKWTFLLSSYEEGEFKVVMWDKDVGKDDKMSSLRLPLRDFTVGADFEERNYPMRPAPKMKKGGILKVRMKITCENPSDIPGLIAPADPEHEYQNVIPEAAPALPVASTDAPVVILDDTDILERGIPMDNEGRLSFKWESYSSHYTVSFSGYTLGDSISDLHDGEDNGHHHEVYEERVSMRKEEEITDVKTGRWVLSGKIIGAREIAKMPGAETGSFVVVKIWGRPDKKGKQTRKTQVVPETPDPDFDFDFDLGEVKRGDAVEFTVYQTRESLPDLPIGYFKQKILTFPLDNPDPIEIKLGRHPKYQRQSIPFSSWGSLLIVVTPSIKEAAPEE